MLVAAFRNENYADDMAQPAGQRSASDTECTVYMPLFMPQPAGQRSASDTECTVHMPLFMCPFHGKVKVTLVKFWFIMFVKATGSLNAVSSCIHWGV